MSIEPFLPDGSRFDRLEQLTQEFLSDWRDGQLTSIEVFAKQHPDLEEELLDLLPAILLAEQLNPIGTMKVEEPICELPARLGPFVLQREIGRGGMGIVYEASQAPLTQTVAVKVLKTRLFASSTISSRFAREAEASSRLHHPNIVPARHYGVEGKQNYLVMQMVDGVSLDRLINAHENVDPALFLLFEEICGDWNRIAKLGSQVASALSHAHENGMVHRDIKPANLILDREGNVWVTDFGLAKIFDDESDLSRTDELIGTPRYMAPEQLLGVADERSDIYALGLTLYEILTRNFSGPLRAGIDRSQKTSMMRASSPNLEIPDIRSLNPRVPEQLASAIMQSCAHYPESRYQSARQFEFALNQQCHTGQSDRRDIARTKAITSQNQARSATMHLALAATLGIAGWQVFDFRMNEKSASMHDGHKNSQPEANCIVFEEPRTDLTNVVVAINSRQDDAEEHSQGAVHLDGTGLELTWNETNQLIGLRFAGVEIPRGTKIHSAKLSFNAERTDYLPTNLSIFGLDDADPDGFAPLEYDISKRPRIKQSVRWSPGQWERGQTYETPPCTDIVQAIIDKPEWKSGNAIGFAIHGTGIRTATAYDGNIYQAARLAIQYRKDTDVAPHSLQENSL